MRKPKATVHSFIPLHLDKNTIYRIECITRDPEKGLELRFSHYLNRRRSQNATIIPLHWAEDFQEIFAQVLMEAKMLDKGDSL